MEGSGPETGPIHFRRFGEWLNDAGAEIEAPFRLPMLTAIVAFVSRLRLFVFVSLALTLVAPIAHASVGVRVVGVAPSPAVLEAGKKVYRQFCGQCHALKEARAVGFGSAKKKGVGEDGGPSLDPLKVSYAMSVASITMLFGGHEKVVSKMTWKQIKDVSWFLQYATRHHKIVAKFSDG